MKYFSIAIILSMCIFAYILVKPTNKPVQPNATVEASNGSQIKQPALASPLEFSNGKDNKSEVQCAVVSELFVPTRDWKVEKKVALNELVLQLEQEGLSHPLWQNFLKISGIGLERGRTLIRNSASNKSQNELIELSLPSTGRLFSPDDNKALLTAIENGDVNQLNDFFKTKDMTRWVYKQNPTKLMSPLTAVMTSFSSSLDGAELFQLLNELIINKAQVRINDLATASALGLNEATLQLLENNSADNLNQYFNWHGQAYNLLSFALNYNNYETAIYWASQGIGLTTLLYYDNALDHLARASLHTDDLALREKLGSLFQVLISAGLKPNNYQSYPLLIKLIPKQSMTESSLQAISIFEFEADKPQKFHYKEVMKFANAIGEFIKIMLFDKNNKAYVPSLVQECQLVVASELVQQVYTGSANTAEIAQNKTTEKILDTHNSIDVALDHQHKIEALGRLGDTSSKFKVEQYLHRFMPHNEPELEKFIAEKLEAGTNDLNLAYELSDAVANNDIDRVRFLLTQDAPILPDISLIAAASSDLAIIKLLASYGTNFDFVAADGRNAISLAANLSKLDIVGFLIESGVNVKPNQYGLDPLDYILSDLVYTKDTTSQLLDLVDALIYAGASIETSHIEYVDLLAKEKPQIYQMVTAKHPLLEFR